MAAGGVHHGKDDRIIAGTTNKDPAILADAASGREQSCGPQCDKRRLQKEVLRGGGYSHDWNAEPGVGRVADGIPARSHKLRAYGNAIVPQVAAEFIKAAM